ncbi:MAG TPA: low molecular weight protein-tyrosine-phosphatase [Kofleriaceae bacterium]|nr:low molecular weight protein-tyrosine-phosphatase [Kofleriaceae bacterium]
MVHVCFVCLGNICRSPTAEGVMQHLVEAAGLGDRIAIDSAGTGAWHAGEPADRRARQAATRRGLRLDSIARQVTIEDFTRFDYLLAMDPDNLRDLQELAPDADARARVHLFRSFDPAAPAGAAVPDPYYGGPDGFDEVLDICEAACAGLLEHLRREHGL